MQKFTIRKEIVQLMKGGKVFNLYTGKIHPSLRGAKISRRMREKKENCCIQFCFEGI